ncbi:RNA-binding domain-containing protein, partial [Tothia fuscella]
ELKPIKEKKRKAAVVGEPEKAVKTKKSKTASIGAVAPTSISKSNSNSKETNGMKDKKSKADVKIATPAENTFVSSDDDEDNIADQTAALLAGFDSSSEESEHEDGLALEQVPEAKISKKERKALAAAKNEKPGTIYIGRVPHGFFEHQMRAYFTQFGTILRLRLSRNKKTGASKHYAFIEFESSDVADIVAKTMNNYLMFGHILKVRRIPDEQVHPDLWKGAGKRFKVVPRGRMEARRLNTPKGREYWRMKVEKEGEKRLEKAERLKEMGYVFEMPAVRRVDDVPMRDVDDDDVVVGEKEGTKAITEIAAEDEDPVKEEIDVVAVVPDEAPKA